MGEVDNFFLDHSTSSRTHDTPLVPAKESIFPHPFDMLAIVFLNASILRNADNLDIFTGATSGGGKKHIDGGEQ